MKATKKLTGFSHLTSVIRKDHDEITISNLLTELYRRFPETSFTINKYDEGSIGLKWLNGPSGFKVAGIKNMFMMHGNEITEFNRQYGGLDTIYLERDMIDEIRELVHELDENHTVNHETCMDDLIKIWWRTDIPAGAKNFRLEKISNDDLIEYMYSIKFDIEEK